MSAVGWLPALREFTEAVPELGIEEGDRVWITHDSATVVRTFSFAEIRPPLDQTQPIRLGEEVDS